VVREALSERGQQVAGFEVKAHIRPNSSKRRELRAEFEALGAQVGEVPWEEDRLVQLIREFQPECCISVLGTTKRRGRKSGGKDSYESVDRDLTLLLHKTLLAEAPQCRLVFLSSLGTSAGKRNGYLGARARVEEALSSAALPYVIVRPSFITGPDREESRPLERIFALISDAGLSIAGSLGATRMKEKFASTDASGLARALLSACVDPNLERQILEGSALRRSMEWR